jgi:thiamine pyrophosphate-dependent acetolactate synthase large subunit-like protein
MILGDKAKSRTLGENLDNPTIDFCQIAKSMGIEGRKVLHPNELSAALTSAFKSDKPGLIEVYIDKPDS